MPAEYSRRDFLGMATKIGTSLLVGSESRATENEGLKSIEKEKTTNNLHMMSFDLSSDKLKFPKEKKELDEGVKTVIMALLDFKREISKLNNKNEKIEFEIKCWKIISSIASCDSHEFSSEVFYNFLYTKLPNFLAEYGILLMVDYASWVDKNSQEITSVDPSFKFYSINKMTSDDFSYIDGNKSFERDIIYVEPLVLDGQSVNDRSVYKNSVAQTYGQNIVIYENKVEETKKDEQKDYEEKYDYLVNQLSDEKIYQYLSSVDAKEQSESIVKMVYTLLLRRVYKNRMDVGDIETHIAHETGHVLHQMEKDFKIENAPTNFKTITELEKWRKQMTLTAETRAKIFALILSKNKYLALVAIFNDVDNDAEMSGHLSSNAFLQQMIVKELLDNHEDYGIEYDTTSSVLLKHQAAFKIIELAGDNKKIELLGKRLLELVRSEESSKFKSKARDVEPLNSIPDKKIESGDKIKKEYDFNLCGKDVGIGLGALGIVGGGVLLLKKILERRNAVANIPPTSKRKNKKH